MKTAPTTNEESQLVIEDIKQNFNYLEKSVQSFDPRFTLKVLRGLPALRKRVDANALTEIVQLIYPTDDPAREFILKYTNGDVTKLNDQAPTFILPEVDIYMHLLTLVWLMNTGTKEQFKRFAESCVRRIKTYNRRSLDYMNAKIYFYYSRAYELTDSFDTIRPMLLTSLRTATLNHDTETQASIITLLLRNYLTSHQVSQAANLVSKTNFPDNASNAMGARYFYYLAKIDAIQLNYSQAFERVTTAIRKAPQTSLATGFLQQANKLSVVVELLMGDIPERTIFKQPEMEKPLNPYFDVASTVRVGDINQFSQVISKHSETLKQDGTFSLVLRLRQNVIKTGIRIMSLTYSRISLKDICVRLQLDSEECAEYVVAKAIRDGVIDATIDHEKGYMQSNEVLDVYSSSEPQDTFHERIKFCISLHDESVKSMRYLANTRVDLKNVASSRNAEQELFDELEDEDFD